MSLLDIGRSSTADGGVMLCTLSPISLRGTLERETQA